MIQSFPQGTHFKFPWRTYQKRILNELESALEDKRLHVIAAPGSGKTVLGIEVVRRLNRPALILVPTLAIQQQWIERLVDLFLPESEGTPEWISKDIKTPRFFTVSTYQGLHSAFSGEILDEEDEETEELEEEPPVGREKRKKEATKADKDLTTRLKEANIKTIVVDEAHHLRTNWWKSLSSIINQLEEPTIVALTATPPFDVSETEWKRYQKLCGPLDAQISVPELVREKNLCPHQDYIMFSTPLDTETEKIFQFKDSVNDFITRLYSNQAFTEYLVNYPWLVNPTLYIRELLDDPTFFSSILVYLHHLGIKIPRETVNIVTVSPKRIPFFDYEWLEILLEGLLFPPKNQKSSPLFLEEIKRELNQIGALERRTINFRAPKEIENLLKRSSSKLKSINRIVNLEYDSLGHRLRMVILTDYIRKSFLPRDETDLKPLNKIGVVPIFESIRRECSSDLKLGVLTGSLIIIPTSSIDMLKSCALTCDINQDNLKITQLSFTPDFVEVDIVGTDKQHKVQLITDLFSNGGIQLVIGTKALLGEGWDAPAINTLILASFIGSYMLSNQMRGRAIRIDRDNPDKTANIWHLICVEPKSRISRIKDEYTINEDFLTLTRRFRAFVGPTFGTPMIENGLKRLDIGEPPFTNEEIKLINNTMIQKALDRNQMKEDWELALKRGEEGVKLIEDIKTKKEALPQGFVFMNTINAILYEGFFILLVVLSYYLESFGEVLFEAYFYSLEIFFIFLFFGLLIPTIAFLPYFLRAMWLFVKHGPIRSSMNQIGIALLKSLIYAGVIKTDYQNLRIKVQNDQMGSIFCHLEGGTNREKDIFLDAFQEILNPIENPRYILVRKSLLLKRLGRLDYHSVPSILGTRKKNALHFAKMWQKYVGKMELVFTRNIQGRMMLLKARNHSLSSYFLPRSERISRWC
ncbi:MAG: DEAD/DEAH box helicase family protein [Candidatus Hodarchaeota archaeon]